MKLNGLKQLVKEELERALNKVKVKVDYITAEKDGGPGIDGSTTEQIDQADYDKYKDNLLSSFWRGIAQEAADERIYKIKKITKL
jgi:hypothetical protein